METLQAIKARKSVRGFKPDQVPDTVINDILDAANEAPVGMGLFDKVRFIVVQDKNVLKKISDACSKGTPNEGKDIFYGSSTVVLIAIGDQDFEDLKLSDASALATTTLIAATDLGIDSVYVYGAVVGFKNDKTLVTDVGLTPGYNVYASVALGYGTDEAKAAPKPSRHMVMMRILER